MKGGRKIAFQKMVNERDLTFSWFNSFSCSISSAFDYAEKHQKAIGHTCPSLNRVLTYIVGLQGRTGRGCGGLLGVLQLLIAHLKLLALGLDAKLDTLNEWDG